MINSRFKITHRLRNCDNDIVKHLVSLCYNRFFTPDSIYAIARIMISPARLSVRQSVCHTGESYKNG